MKKAFVIISLTLLLLTGCNNKELNLTEQTQSDKTDLNTLRVSGDFDSLLKYEDNNVLFKASKYVALVKIDTISGSDNYSSVTDSYVMPYTYGKMTILKTFKGNLSENSKVNFYSLGATIDFEKYYEGLTEGEKNKIDRVYENRTVPFKYVDFYMGREVKIQESKSYLVYLVDETAYHNESNSYAILGLDYGVRQIRINDNSNLNSVNNYGSLDVLNNETGEYEKLSNVINEKYY